MFKGFKSFVMRGDVITVAIGLVVALAFSNLVKAFTDSVINPLVEHETDLMVDAINTMAELLAKDTTYSPSG